MTASGFACLPMYDFPWTASANEALYRAVATRLREEGIAAPPGLTRGRPLDDIWRDPKLILGQTCGYPYWFGLRATVALIATPLYAFDGCDGANHRSFLIARRGDPRRDIAAFRHGRAALNARDSNSGMNLFRAAVAPFAWAGRFFAEIVVTGAHAASLSAVAAGAADVAAIDCVSFALLARGRPDLVEHVEVIARSAATPALPFITSAATSAARIAAIRRCLLAALADPAVAPDLATLGLVGAEVLEPDAYARVAELERNAVELGYPELA
jgi:ABC-type phosphate/phosphonate transport system substrate-binding protein